MLYDEAFAFRLFAKTNLKLYYLNSKFFIDNLNNINGLDEALLKAEE